MKSQWGDLSVCLEEVRVPEGGWCAMQSQIDCTLTIADEEPGNTCRQTLEGHVAFRLMVLGSLAERIVVDSLHKVYLGIPAIVQR